VTITPGEQSMLCFQGGERALMFVSYHLDAFAKLRKATFNYVMFVRASISLHGTTRLSQVIFSCNFLFEDF
jgi:hypothetical protein